MKKVLHWLDQVEKIICVAAILIMLVVLSYQVLSRYVVKQSNIWTEELARYLYIWLVFVGVSYAEREFIHIKIDVLGKVFPKKFRPTAALIGEILLFAFAVYMVYVSIPYVQATIARGQFSQALKISMAFPYIAIPFGFALLAIRVLLNIITKKYIPADEIEDLGCVDPDMIPVMDESELEATIQLKDGSAEEGKEV